MRRMFSMSSARAPSPASAIATSPDARSSEEGERRDDERDQHGEREALQSEDEHRRCLDSAGL